MTMVMKNYGDDDDDYDHDDYDYDDGDYDDDDDDCDDDDNDVVSQQNGIVSCRVVSRPLHQQKATQKFGSPYSYVCWLYVPRIVHARTKRGEGSGSDPNGQHPASRNRRRRYEEECTYTASSTSSVWSLTRITIMGRAKMRPATSRTQVEMKMFM